MNVPPSALSRDLNALLTNTPDHDLRVGDLLDAFSKRGHALLIVVLSFPLALPLGIPFIAGPFGVVIAFLAFYLIGGRKPWLPKRLREWPIRRKVFERIVERLIWATQKMEHLVRPRLPSISTGTWSVRIHALLVILLGIVLALPVPFPFSNTVAAIPIFLIGLGLLEGDGLAILAGDAAALICLGFYVALVWVVRKDFMHMLHLL